jgi:hypothetical protein
MRMHLPNLGDEELLIRQRLKDDLAHYASRCLKIRPKAGSLVPLVFNRAQRFIHERLEEQKARTGKVRALILKGRQQGCSTYVGARFYHRCSHSKGLRVFILTHEDPATQNLFEMVERFHEHCNELVRPSTGTANAKELYFDLLDSGYKVGTAGSKGVGRSSTIQLFHGSEVAFWAHTGEHTAGIMQAIPDGPESEIILESTAKGMGNFFHVEWQNAERGLSDYIAIFVPWYWQDEYAREVTADFVLSPEEAEYQALYKLTPEQMAWRRAKIIELKDPLLFKQEYPAVAAEAFQMTGRDSYIAPALILKARKANAQASGPLVIGFDPAWTGGDRHSMAWRRGRKLERIESKVGLDTMQSVGWLVKVIKEDKPAKVFIDVGGVGAGVYDRAIELGFTDKVVAVNFGSRPYEPYDESKSGPANRRAEIWMKSKEWLEEPAGVSIPDSDTLQADACGPGYKYNSNSQLLIESKEDMRKRGISSPDEWDAVALTFAEPVADAAARWANVKSDIRWIV